jgi:hypothetical protein
MTAELGMMVLEDDIERFNLEIVETNDASGLADSAGNRDDEDVDQHIKKIIKLQRVLERHLPWSYKKGKKCHDLFIKINHNRDQ